MDFGSDRRPYAVLGVTPCTIRPHVRIDRAASGGDSSHGGAFHAVQEQETASKGAEKTWLLGAWPEIKPRYDR